MANIGLYWKRFWRFIWEEDSIWSWIANIVLTFILIKYVVFPFLGLLLGTEFPVVAVVSTSMEHDEAFDQWWSSEALCEDRVCTQSVFYGMFNITKEEFKNFRFRNGFNKGDVMVLTSAQSIGIGDTAVFFAKDGRPIIHRVVSLDPIKTKGDHNKAQIMTSQLNENNVSRQDLIGKAWFRIPLLGYVKILFVELASLFGVQVR